MSLKFFKRLRPGLSAVALLAAAAAALGTFADGAEFEGPSVSFADIVERVSPAVVNIAVTAQLRPAALAGPGGRVPADEFFERFFGMPDRPGNPAMPRQRTGQGSGFIVDRDGYIVTNQHVVDGAEHVVVTLQSGEQLEATVIGQDSRTDIALLKVDSDAALPALEFGDSDRARVGDWVLAIGNPFGLGGTATAGIVSARGRDIRSGPYDDYLQIDAPINLGNSGGPVFNADGEVIGINTAIFSVNGGSVGIGFAIPANQAEDVVDELKANGSVNRGWLGVQIMDLDAERAASLGLGDAGGAVVAELVVGGPAARAGIEAGDVIVELDGERVESARALGRMVGDRDAEDRVSVGLYRNGERLSLGVTLGDLATNSG